MNPGLMMGSHEGTKARKKAGLLEGRLIAGRLEAEKC